MWHETFRIAKMSRYLASVLCQNYNEIARDMIFEWFICQFSDRLFAIRSGPLSAFHPPSVRNKSGASRLDRKKTVRSITVSVAFINMYEFSWIRFRWVEMSLNTLFQKENILNTFSGIKQIICCHWILLTMVKLRDSLFSAFPFNSLKMNLCMVCLFVCLCANAKQNKMVLQLQDKLIRTDTHARESACSIDPKCSTQQNRIFSPRSATTSDYLKNRIFPHLMWFRASAVSRKNFGHIFFSQNRKILDLYVLDQKKKNNFSDKFWKKKKFVRSFGRWQPCFEHICFCDRLQYVSAQKCG